jgi:hypothetical protein
MPKFPESCEFGEAEQTKSVAVQCLPLKRADDQRSGEPFTDPRRLGPVEISAAAPGNGLQPFQLLPVGSPEFILRCSEINEPDSHFKQV